MRPRARVIDGVRTRQGFLQLAADLRAVPHRHRAGALLDPAHAGPGTLASSRSLVLTNVDGMHL